jgi:hypothetical protein
MAYSFTFCWYLKIGNIKHLFWCSHFETLYRVVKSKYRITAYPTLYTTFVIVCRKHTKSEYSRVLGYDAMSVGKQLWCHIMKSRIFIRTAVGTSFLAYKYHLITIHVYTKLIVWNLWFLYGDWDYCLLELTFQRNLLFLSSTLILRQHVPPKPQYTGYMASLPRDW